MQTMLSGKSTVAGLRSPQCSSRPRVAVAARAQATTTVTKEETKVTTEEPASSGKQKVYIGFEKGDYAPRAGRQGRFVEDDVRKYPGRDGWLTGGWAGGEVGLKQFAQDAYKTGIPADAKPVDGKKAQPIGRGIDTIYVGHAKDDYDGKRSGTKGRFIKDDVRKYPGREGWLTGGFAGGEVGLKTYVEVGDVPIAAPGKGLKQQSPLLIAGLLGGAASVGGLLLFDAVETGEQVLNAAPAVEAVRISGLDDNTKALLQAAVLLAGLTGVVAGGRAIASAAANSIREGAVKLGTLAVFWTAVFLAAQFVLRS